VYLQKAARKGVPADEKEEKARKGIGLLMLEYSLLHTQRSALSCSIAGFGHKAAVLGFSS